MDDSKAGRQLSRTSRQAIQRAIDALLALIGEADNREVALNDAREALQQLTDDDNLIDGFLIEPAKGVEILSEDNDMDEDTDLTPCDQKAIKVIDADNRRIGLYATVWGELDCDKDRMTKQAIEPYVDGEHTPHMFWLHGLNPDFGSSKPGKWHAEAFSVDDIGLWVEGTIYKNATGNKAWERIEQSEQLGASVGSAGHFVKRKRNADGSRDIIDWPLFEISIMEGGQQCVPSAISDTKSDLTPIFEEMAAKMDLTAVVQEEPVVELEPEPESEPIIETPETIEEPTFVIGGKVMSEQINVDAMVAEQVKAALEAEREAERKRLEDKEKYDSDVKTRADEIVAAQIEEAKKEWEEASRKNQRPPQPTTPPGGAPENTSQSVFNMISPYDRLDTFDLCLRYELMKSYGRQPSTKFWRALASRVVELSQAEDTLYIKNGQPHKVPAIDWDVIIPRTLDLDEIDGEVFGAKTGQFGRYAGLDTAEDNVTPRGIKQMVEIAVKANEVVYSTQANAGDEWVPTLMTAQLWRTIRLNAAVLGLFDQFDMPSQPYDYPAESTDPTFYKVGETTDEAQLVLTGGPFTDSKPGTAKITFSASKLGAISYWSEEMEEDSIIAVEPQMRDQYGIKMAHAIDEVLISGDETTGTANISFEGSTITANSRFLCVDGLRHEALVTTTTDSRDGGVLTVDDFGSTQALMGTAGKFGVNPADQAFIMDSATWHKAKLMSEVLTVDKFGAAATVLTGQLAGLFGVPIIVSEDYGLTDTTGRIDETAGDNTKGSFMAVNRRGVMVGWRRRPRIRVVGLPGAEARYIVASSRFDIRYKEAGMVGLTYNLTV